MPNNLPKKNYYIANAVGIVVTVLADINRCGALGHLQRCSVECKSGIAALGGYKAKIIVVGLVGKIR